MIKPIRPAHSLLRRRAVKTFSQKVTQKTDRVQREDIASDPRPPWVYSTSAGLRLILIPSILFYAIFLADFGDREHVFMPPRRWFQRQWEAFLTITPEERKLVEGSMSSQAGDKTPKGDDATPSER
ncbi:hypothetical protein F5888DRAFT_1801562 [Russula emetica]|nr:hypothetical protein F5888DRAFT_1801562 [Russula emetica]